MCGLSCFFFRECGSNADILEPLLNAGQERGKDGFGYTILNDHYFRMSKVPYTDTNKIINNIGSIPIGSVFISNHRAAPETEKVVDINNLNKTLQPIVNSEEGLFLVHNGSVSNFIVNEMKNKYKFETNIDSEAILAAYLNFDRDMKRTMKYLSGGFSFLLVDTKKKRLYAVCTHNPLYAGYVRGYGLFFSSTRDGVTNTVSKIKNVQIEKCTMNIWEDYYFHQIKEYTVCEIDLDSGMQTEYNFTPRYITTQYDPYLMKHNGHAVLVSASGGLDSSVTLAKLKHDKMNPIAIHFKYGHRGQDAEELAIRNITDILDVPLVVFDIEQNMKLLDSGMLTNSNSDILTGTDTGLKTTVAWTVFRNHLFLTYMGAYAEKLIMEKNYKEVYLTGGFMQLTESGVYPDNSERFLESALKFFKFSITGTRIKPYYGMANLLKTDEYRILDELELLEKISPWLVSCDRPIVSEIELYGEKKLVPMNCRKNGIPACGSGLLSAVAAKRAGVADLRYYYDVDDSSWEPSQNYIEILK